MTRQRLTVLMLSAAYVALAATAILRTPVAVRAQASTPAPDTVAYYNGKVVPVFQANCYRCHGGMNHRGGLSMETRTGMLQGGRDGTVLVPGHADQSLLIKLIRHEGPANDPMPMPPRGDKLSDADIAIVTAWVNAGAVMPADKQ